MGLCDPKSIEALRWTAMEEDNITIATVVKQCCENQNPQMHLPAAVLKKPW